MALGGLAAPCDVGGFAAFVTSSGTMDKADRSARKHIAKSSDLIAAVRLPEGSFRADAGTDVVVDILFFRKRKSGEPEGDQSWLDTEEVRPATADEGAIRVNRWLARHPDFVLGTHALTSGPFGETYTCRPRDGEVLEAALAAAIDLLPSDLYDGEPTPIDIELEDELAAMLGGFFILDDPIFGGLAVSLIFGLFVSTVLTLLVIPVVYYHYYWRGHETQAGPPAAGKS